MGLVDYSSDDEGSGGEETQSKATASALPPLPRGFHDLYASTVRNSTADDPSLHQGRHRAIPHVAGQWPSHIYIEWFPLPLEHTRLSQLLASLRTALGEDAAFHSFLTSDLGAPLPLHISLSRPFMLTTAEKAQFLTQLVDGIRSSGVGRFDVAFDGLDWFRSPDSARAFLVLGAIVKGSSSMNEPLMKLLDRSNEQVTAVGQPALYARKSVDGDDPAVDSSSFHVSVAWTLASNIDAWTDTTRNVYEGWQASRPRSATW
ncbi:poly(U)-specific 3'-to-5' RNA exonuclease [Sporothrix stenoceras]|uniref:U6 snRNA phosphodiesterase n=1 Tax=Sporothrix stenoceras TaxID=5173 RepID=A0ABR3YK59_9PEZI